MKRDITEEISRAEVVPSELKHIEKLMKHKYKDLQIFKRNRKRK